MTQPFYIGDKTAIRKNVDIILSGRNFDWLCLRDIFHEKRLALVGCYWQRRALYL